MTLANQKTYDIDFSAYLNDVGYVGIFEPYSNVQSDLTPWDMCDWIKPEWSETHGQFSVTTEQFEIIQSFYWQQTRIDWYLENYGSHQLCELLEYVDRDERRSIWPVDVDPDDLGLTLAEYVERECDIGDFEENLWAKKYVIDLVVS